MPTGEFLSRISKHCGDGWTHIHETTVRIEFVQEITQRFDHAEVALKRMVQLHLQVALFEGFLYGKEELREKSGRSFEEQKVGSVLEGLNGRV